MAAASVMAAQFAGAAVLGFLLGLFMASRFLPRGGGPTRRVLRVVGLASLALICGAFWAAAAGLVNFQEGSGQSLGTAGNYGLAAGLSAGVGLVTLRRARGPWRESVAAGPDRAQPNRAQPGRLRPAQRVIRVADYVLGAWICYMLLWLGLFSSMKPVQTSFAHWLDGFFAPPTAALVARLGLELAGFLYGQLISGAAIKALSVALRRDWAVSRKWHYMLLVPPFALFAPLAIVLPGLLSSIVLYFATLYVGYRYTSEPPGTALQTLKLLQQQRRRAARCLASASVPRGLDDLQRAFLDAHAAGPGARVSALERILNELFTASGLAPERPFARYGEQIDGSFTHRGTGYALAARWPGPAERAGLIAFGGPPPGGRPGQARLLVSAGGFAPGVHQAYITSVPVIAMDGGHLLAVLEQRIGLSELLDRLKRHADQTGHPYLPVAQALAV
jgi:hypothetical protein